MNPVLELRAASRTHGSGATAVEALVADVTHDELVALRQHVPQLALESPWRGGRLVSLAERLVSLAEGGLERRPRLSRDGRDERIHLARLKRLVERCA